MYFLYTFLLLFSSFPSPILTNYHLHSACMHVLLDAMMCGYMYVICDYMYKRFAVCNVWLYVYMVFCMCVAICIYVFLYVMCDYVYVMCGYMYICFAVCIVWLSVYLLLCMGCVAICMYGLLYVMCDYLHLYFAVCNE